MLTFKTGGLHQYERQNYVVKVTDSLVAQPCIWLSPLYFQITV